MSEQNMLVFRRLLEEVWNKGNLSLLPELLDDNYVGHATPHQMTLNGWKKYEQRIAIYKGLFPEILFTVEDQFASGDKVATRWTAALKEEADGTQGEGDTGQPTILSGISISRMENGRIIEDWDTWDTLTLLESSENPDIMHALNLSL